MPNLPPRPAATATDPVPVMVGTAGHVHHGKSALVKMLTGCDTMHLPEERSRKLTIDLGFAPCQLSGRRLVGIVDVPGHEDFIRNMVAGAAAIDVLMLVVAADDGVMPQTREHLAIIATLRSPRAMGVVNKCDLVEPARRDEVAGEVRALLARAGFPDAPVVCASCRSGEGLDAVYETLDRLVLAAAARAADPRAFRMDVERVFSVPGHGTVATGVPRSGAVAVGEALELLPAGVATQLKGAQAYKHEAQRVAAGSCAALNLRDLAAEAVTRGMTVAAPGIFRATTGIVVGLRNVAESLTLKRRQEVRLHAGTGATVATVKLLGAQSLPPGAEGFAALALREPLVLAAGDRVLLRALSPEITVAGGTVLGAGIPAALKDTPELLARLERARSALPDVLVAACWAGPEPSLTLAEARRLTQLPPSAAAERVAEAMRAGLLVDLGEERLAVAERLAELAALLRKTLARFHAAHRLSVGMEPAQACAALGLPAGCFPRLAALMAGHGCAERHGRLTLADFAPPVGAALAAQRERLLAHLAAAGVNAPARGNLLKELDLGEKDLDTLTKLLVEEGAIRLIGANLMPTAVLDDCRARLLALFAKSPTVELAAFRAATGLSRNLGVAVLELFDREGLTRREGQARVLVKKV